MPRPDARAAVPSARSLWPCTFWKWTTGFSIALLSLAAFGLRCIHLLSGDHYFIVSADSHYFHRMAELLASGETIFYPTHATTLPIGVFGGIAYPLAFIARAIALISPMPPLEAVSLASRLLAPALGVATLLVIYLVVSRFYGRSAAILAALVWALLVPGVPFQAAGYLDRDCLSLLLIGAGILLFYIVRTAKTIILGHDFAWLASASVIVAFEALLYVEWGFLGPAILLTITLAFFLGRALNSLFVKTLPVIFAEDNILAWPLAATRTIKREFSMAMTLSGCKPLMVILAFNVAAIALRPDILRQSYNLGTSVLRGSVSGESTVAELAGIGPADIQAYGLLVVPIVLGLYVALRRRNETDLLFLSWFGVLLVAGLISRRLFLYATPAASVLAGLGFAALLDPKGVAFSRIQLAFLHISLFDPLTALRPLLGHLRIVLGAVLLLSTIAVSTFSAYSFASKPPMAADTDWLDALHWLRQHTDEDAIVMSWWDYGYWIMDIGHRTPVVDNGVHTEEADRDIASVYMAEDDSAAVAIMNEYNAGYLVFSKVERRFFPHIAGRVAMEAPDATLDWLPPDFRDSLYARSFLDDFESEAGLTRVYPFPEVSEPPVVILALA